MTKVTTIAKVVCPMMAVVLVGSFLIGVSRFDPEPEITSPIGWLLFTPLLVATQLPLAVAPFLRLRRPLRATCVLMMLPTTALLTIGIVDLLPRFIMSDGLPVGTFAIEVAGLAAYFLAFLVTFREPSSNSTLQPTPTAASSS